MRHIIVTFVYALAFMIRAVYNTIQSYGIASKLRNDPTDWRIFLLSFHLMVEIIPMAIVFSFQIHSNLIRHRTMQ